MQDAPPSNAEAEAGGNAYSALPFDGDESGDDDNAFRNGYAQVVAMGDDDDDDENDDAFRNGYAQVSAINNEEDEEEDEEKDQQASAGDIAAQQLRMLEMDYLRVCAQSRPPPTSGASARTRQARSEEQKDEQNDEHKEEQVAHSAQLLSCGCCDGLTT